MFSVIWSSSAQSDYTVIAFSYFDRSVEINRAGDEIDSQLKQDPIQNGQHLSEGLWRIEAGPLADNNIVSIDAVRWIG